jgi:hypothetical protein
VVLPPPLVLVEFAKVVDHAYVVVVESEQVRCRFLPLHVVVVVSDLVQRMKSSRYQPEPEVPSAVLAAPHLNWVAGSEEADPQLGGFEPADPKYTLDDEHDPGYVCAGS